MNYLDRIQKGVDFIEDNLDVDIPLSEVAKEAYLSQWHFQRIFKALTNETLKSYIRGRRLSNALDKLLNSDDKTLDIAITAGFESQESFTRAFKKAFNITPNAARHMKDKNALLSKVQIDKNYLSHINQNISLVPDIDVQPKMLLVGMKTTFYGSGSHKNNIADRLPALWQEFEPKMSDIQYRVPSIAYGVIRQISDDSDLLEYYAACEVSELESIPEGMDSIKIPAARYATFTHKGDVKKMDETVNYIYSNWLMQSNEYHNGEADLEIYGEEFFPDSEHSLVRYAVPIG